MPQPPRRVVALVAALAASAASLVLPASPAQAQSTLSLAWEHHHPGNRYHLSSPTLGDVDGDGIDDIAIGGLDGWVRVYRADGSTIWERPAIVRGSSTPTAVDSSPTIADLDGDGANEVIVGAVSNWVPNQHGGLVVFDRHGNIRWNWAGQDIFHMWNAAAGATPDGYSEGVASTPAIGDVDGDGRNDVVFGAFDNQLHALDHNGNNIPGFPIWLDDSIWSSPALYDVDGDGRHEIFVGFAGTPGGPIDHRGGLLRAIDYQNGPVTMWERRIGEVIDGSPAIGDINGDGRMELVVTTSTNYQHPHGDYVWAWHADDGSDVPGWPQLANGDTVGSPALGDVDGNGVVDVVVGDRGGIVHAWRGDGSHIWAVAPNQGGEGGGQIVTSPVIADLDGNGSQDVAIGNGWGTFLLRGSDGSRLYQPIGIGWSYQNAPAVGSFGNLGSRIIIAGLVNFAGEFGGGDGHIFAYQLPNQGAPAHWPMFRKSANHVGAPPSGGDPLPPGYCRRPSNPEPTPSPASARGYWFLGRDGGVFSFGDVSFHGSLPDIGVTTPAAAMSARRDGAGYWVVDQDGIVHAFGAAPFHGDMRGQRLNAPIIGLEPTPSGNGYWLLGADGGVFSFGDAQFLGSTGGMRLNAPVIAMRAHPSGQGYWLLGADGGVFTFGAASFHGSTGSMQLAAPVISMTVHPSGDGYWLLGADGGVFSFGALQFHGSIPGIGLCAGPRAVQIRATATGDGYWSLGADGGVFSFGDAYFFGSYPGLTGRSAAVDMAVRT